MGRSSRSGRSPSHPSSLLGIAAAASLLLGTATLLAPAGCGLNRQGALTETSSAGGSGATTGTTTTASGAGGAGIGGFVATGGSATTTSSTTAGGGGQAAVEDCLNGVDDDDDDAVDCADDECLGPYECVAIDAANARFVTDPASDCADGLETVTYYRCSNCTCTPAGGECAMSVTLYKDGGCSITTTAVEFGPDPDSECNNITDFADQGSLKVGARATNEPDGTESCTVGGDSLGPVHDEWCAAPAGGAGCDAGQVCLPTLPTRWCAAIGATENCPPGSERFGRFYADEGTGSCDCGCTPSATCPATQTAVVSTDNGCGGTRVTVTANNQCMNTGLDGARSIEFPPLAANVDCTVQHTLPEASEVRICCEPS